MLQKIVTCIVVSSNLPDDKLYLKNSGISFRDHKNLVKLSSPEQGNQTADLKYPCFKSVWHQTFGGKGLYEHIQ